MRHAAVIDIGKTNAKVALVDLQDLSEIAVAKMPNRVLTGAPWPHYDTDGLWAFVLKSLADFQKREAVEAITVTTHGASVALLTADGTLAAPVLDYEFSGPDELAEAYDAIRPPFSETGSPRLPMGLNLGAQLFWLFRTFPDLREKVATILTYPQYWSYRLSGLARNEVTSLGCHTDLWIPREGRFSSLVDHEGWADLMAPAAKAGDRLGAILPEVAAQTGMNVDTPVYCGIHDSNASLYAHLSSRDAPFSVVSTGTWVISMAIGGEAKELDPARDTLINVNAYGDPVPSARFMGGREFEMVMDGLPVECSREDSARVIEREIMLLPSVEMQSGPFQGRKHYWTVDEAKLSFSERYVAVSFYLALMTATGLDMIGADGPILVEGPFSDNQAYLDMLSAATRRPVEAVMGTGTSTGAARLLLHEQPAAAGSFNAKACGEPDWLVYAAAWRARAEGQ